MEKKYYHDTYFKKIAKMADENRLEEAILEFQKYVKIYPIDVGGYVYYANVLIKMNRLDEAERILNKVDGIINEDTSILSYEEYKRVRISLLCCQKKYQECYQMLQDNISIFYKRKWFFYGLQCFLKRELHILTPEDYARGGYYLINQLFCYSEENAIEHIKRHQYNISDEVFHFSEGFPIEKMYDYFRKILPNNEKYINDNFTNFYIFRFIGSGHIGSKLVDFIKIITFSDSNDIITMYPYENIERRSYRDVTPELEESLKRERLNQIDKFNKRYSQYNKK